MHLSHSAIATTTFVVLLLLLSVAPLRVTADYAYINVYSLNASNVKPTIMDVFNLKSSQVIVSLVVAHGQTDEIHVDFAASIDRQSYFDQLLMLLGSGYEKIRPAGIYQYVGVLETPSPTNESPSNVTSPPPVVAAAPAVKASTTLSNQAIAGIAIGAACGVFLLVFVFSKLYILWYEAKMRRKYEQTARDSDERAANDTFQVGARHAEDGVENADAPVVDRGDDGFQQPHAPPRPGTLVRVDNPEHEMNGMDDNKTMQRTSSGKFMSVAGPAGTARPSGKPNEVLLKKPAVKKQRAVVPAGAEAFDYRVGAGNLNLMSAPQSGQQSNEAIGFQFRKTDFCNEDLPREDNGAAREFHFDDPSQASESSYGLPAGRDFIVKVPTPTVRRDTIPPSDAPPTVSTRPQQEEEQFHSLPSTPPPEDPVAAPPALDTNKTDTDDLQFEFTVND